MTDELAMPEREENGFVKTLNNMGYMTSTLDPISKKFIQFSTSGKNVLEIGAAYGIATLETLSNGAKVIANDIDSRHLDILKNRCPENLKENLTLAPGKFPDELHVPEKSVDAILICRVLHFFSGPEIERAVNIMKSWLIDGGQLFVVAETPYLKNWQTFIPDYESRKRTGERWPGFIDDVKKYEQNRSAFLPESVHWLDADVLRRTFELAGLEIVEVCTIDRQDFPVDIRLDGRESVGIVGRKKVGQ